MLSFLELESQYYDYNQSKFVVVPVPYEKTTTYGKGTKHGPAAILDASQRVENFDEELKVETYKKAGIHTLKSSSIKSLQLIVSGLLNDNKIPIILGGEHSISPFAVKACAEKYTDLSVLSFDAHADLRDEYEGRKDNHACALRRILEISPAVQVGVRSLSQGEYLFAKKIGQLEKIHWANKEIEAEKINRQLSNNVFIDIDVDVFDPSIIPSTGTPEPGGMLWYKIVDILAQVCKTKNVVGVSVTELAPIKGIHAPDFTIAKLIYKIMGYISS
jgi:N1-aminopropylagmatine ureohydrolase